MIMYNAIDVNKFSYNESIRETYRKKLRIEDKIVLLHVGRFSDEKNHIFLINILDKLIKINNKYILLFVGSGQNEEVIRRIVNQKRLTDYVMFLGLREDVAELMNASDIFLLPSKHEGLGITLIEAQSTGLVTFASDRITRETSVTNLIKYLSIENECVWVKEILNVNISLRKSRKDDVEMAGYSIDMQAAKYVEWLQSVLKQSLE